MKSPAQKSTRSRLLGHPHLLCIFAAVVFFAAACAALATKDTPMAASLQAHSVTTPATAPAKVASITPLVRVKHIVDVSAVKTAATSKEPPGRVTHVAKTSDDCCPPDFTRGDEDVKEVAVTFDGGGGKAYEAYEILDVLKDRGVKATIFLTGDFIKRNPDVVRRIVRDGHEVGNHTLNHPHLTEYARNYTQATLKGVGPGMIHRELEGAAALFTEVTGRQMAPLWRAPYGEVNSEIRRWAWQEGYVHVGWTTDPESRESLDTLDWVRDKSSRLYRTSSQIKQRVLSFGREKEGVSGGIILMHLDTGRKTDKAADVLGEMIDRLSMRGYRFVKVSTLLAGNRFVKEAERKRSAQVASVNAPPAGLSHR